MEQLEARVGYACVGILRSLVRKGYLASVIGKKKVVAYKRGPQWPAPASFFESTYRICLCHSDVVPLLLQESHR
jgi:hypothetical protein